MAIKTFSTIVQSMQDGISLRQPALDTKAGTVARDVFIDNTADQIASIYRDYALIQKTQSLLTATGAILEQFGSNYGIQRNAGETASGNAILTFNNLLNNINIDSGTTVTSKTGVVFRITANIIISAATKGIYASYASSIADQLHVAGISDQYAVQVPIQSINVGANGNIPAYSLVKTSIPGISNVTNISPTTGGTNPQGDPQYRNQILAGLSGSSAGTARGYQNALLAVSGIQSVFIAGPGSPILTRDGTVTQRNSDGSLTVLSPGTGGKIDIWVQGSDVVNISESYIFHDISGSGDVTSPLNAHILGQTTDTATLTPSERRQLYVNSGQLPLQPVEALLSLSGSISGSNFVQGVNYELVKDTNTNTENTAFALDNIVFLQNFISISGENVAKGASNSVDALVFSGIRSVEAIQQDIIITNDLAALDVADHTKIKIVHNPLSTVQRATNLTTGERYTITNQNLDPNTGLNESGTVFIDGSVLPSAQDLIQVDYTWNFAYDSNVDYFSPGNVQFLTTGIDWGRSNYIAFEEALLIRNGNRYNLGISRNIDRVYSAFYCDTQTSVVQQANLIDQTGTVKALRQITITTGSSPVVYLVMPGISPDLLIGSISSGDIVHIYTDTALNSRAGTYVVVAVIDSKILQIEAPTIPLSATTAIANIQINAADDLTVLIPVQSINLTTNAEDIASITNVLSVRDQNTGLELYATEAGGRFSGNTIYLATDVAQPNIGENVIVYFNAHEIFNVAKNNGAVSSNNVILSTDDVLDFNSVLQPLNDIFNGISVKPLFVDYIATDIDVVTRTSMTLLPFIGSDATSTLVNKNNVSLNSRQPIEFDSLGHIVRSGPAYVGFAIDGAFSSGGTIAIRGNGWIKITSAISVTQDNVGGFFELSSIISAQLGTLSTDYSVVKVSLASLVNNGIATNLLIRGYALSDNTYDSGIAINAIGASSTGINFAPILEQNNLSILTIGSILNITFYVLAPNIAETIQFTNGRGTLYTKYKYARVNRIDLISGFLTNNVITGNIRIIRQSQPATGSTYLTDYSYFGPVENELLTIQYRYNQIIQDATNAIENVRTLTADVLTRLAIEIVINVSMTVILTNQAINQQSQIIDQAISAATNLINNNSMGTPLDYSALLRVVTAISGISGGDVIVFDYVGSDLNGIGNRKVIHADANQYLVAGTINMILGIR